MAGHSRKVDESLLIHSLQLLTSRRFELYGSLTPLLARLEDAIAQKSVRRIIETYAEIRRFLRESLAFLNRPIYQALQGMEEAMEAGADSVGGIDLDRLRLEMVRLHVEFARAIREPAFEPVEDTLGLSIATRIRLRERPSVPAPSADQDVMAQALDQSRSGWSHLKAKRFRNGIKHFRRAVALLPGVPKFRADLALSLQLAGESREAVIQATAALQGYAADLSGDAAERREARRTLGRSLRAVAEEKFDQRQLDEAIREMRKASREMEDSLVDEPEGPVMAAVRSEIRDIRERLDQWEQIWSKVSGVSTLPEEPSPKD